ncbi:diguanylate cyclase domain-containing protein [Marinospirillum sp.]|uniref:diguanylate cyclase domain-containing protein n=1 Tax=Marinospirillum sp. TaxID=2183934 RepID=UPI002870AAA1|nr:diguanylate cyclase [Marinospirillum sp.]MDR9467498.1 diguanylate cyclase [Marinospirillum sp.]
MKKTRLVSLHRRIMVFSLLGVLLTGLLVGIATAIPLYQNARSNLEETTRVNTQAQGEIINNLLGKYQGIAQQFTSRTEIRRRLEAYLQGQLTLEEVRAFTEPRLADAMSLSTAVQGLLRLAEDGKVIARLGDPISPDAIRKKLQSVPDHHQQLISIADQQLLLITAPIHNAQDARIGQDIVFFNLKEIGEVLTCTDRFGAQAQQKLLHLDSNQQLVGTANSLQLELGPLSPALSNIKQLLTQGERDRQLLYKNGQQQVFFFTPLTAPHWTLVIQRPADDFYNPAWAALLWPGITILIMLLLSALGLARVLRPLIADATQQTLRDSLTGLVNRSFLEQKLEKAVAQAERRNTRLCVIFMDLDHFKEVNDSLGHQAGDQLLQRVAQRLKGLMRESDILGRLSGDEFLILLENQKNPQVAEQLAKRIIHSLTQPFLINQQSIIIGVSLGISHYPQDADNARDLIRKADLAMYQAKQKGRNTWQSFTKELDQ